MPDMPIPPMPMKWMGPVWGGIFIGTVLGAGSCGRQKVKADGRRETGTCWLSAIQRQAGKVNRRLCQPVGHAPGRDGVSLVARDHHHQIGQPLRRVGPARSPGSSGLSGQPVRLSQDKAQF
jgi:hypothetical protein